MVFIEFFEEIMDYSPWFSLNFLKKSWTIVQYRSLLLSVGLIVSQDRIMHFPTWIDLKGQDAVPETVHHVVCHVDPVSDTAWHHPQRRAKVSECAIY